jgi:lysozyme
MRVNQAGRDLIAEFEGQRLTAYRCPAGVWTIGIGSTQPPVTPGMQITMDEMWERFDHDIAIFETGVLAALAGAPTTQNQFNAMVSLAFNIGLGGFRTSSVLRAHKAGNTSAAANAFGLWNKATVDGRLVEVPGLTRRRAAETALYLTLSDAGFAVPASAMPQAVAKPATAATSKAVQTNVAVAAGAVTLAGSNLKPAIDAVDAAVQAAKSAQGTWASLRDLLSPLSNGHVYTALIAVGITLAAVYLIRRVFRRVNAGEMRP